MKKPKQQPPKPKPKCVHNFQDVPTAQMIGLKQCVKCGKTEVK